MNKKVLEIFISLSIFIINFMISEAKEEVLESAKSAAEKAPDVPKAL